MTRPGETRIWHRLSVAARTQGQGAGTIRTGAVQCMHPLQPTHQSFRTCGTMLKLFLRLCACVRGYVCVCVCSLEVGNCHRNKCIHGAEARAHFSLWCVTSSPLYL
jgi:hypothetical protein